MKKLGIPIIAIFIVVSMMLSTNIDSFAYNDSDPGGDSMIQLPYTVLYISDNEII